MNRKNVLYVPTYYRYIALKQLTQLRLRQPHRLVFKTDGEPDCVVRLIDDDFVLGLRQITRLIIVSYLARQRKWRRRLFLII